MRPLHESEAVMRNADGSIYKSKTKRTMKEKIKNWMGRNNMMFSAIAGETFTNAEVVYTHIGLVVFLVVLGIAGNF